MIIIIICVYIQLLYISKFLSDSLQVYNAWQATYLSRSKDFLQRQLAVGKKSDNACLIWSWYLLLDRFCLRTFKNFSCLYESHLLYQDASSWRGRINCAIVFLRSCGYFGFSHQVQHFIVPRTRSQHFLLTCRRRLL